MIEQFHEKFVFFVCISWHNKGFWRHDLFLQCLRNYIGYRLWKCWHIGSKSDFTKWRNRSCVSIHLDWHILTDIILCQHTHLLKWCHKQAKHHIEDFIIKQLLENTGLHRLWLENNSTTTSIWYPDWHLKKKKVECPPATKVAEQLWRNRETNSYLCNSHTCTFTQSLSVHIHWQVQICSSTCTKRVE